MQMTPLDFLPIKIEESPTAAPDCLATPPEQNVVDADENTGMEEEEEGEEEAPEHDPEVDPEDDAQPSSKKARRLAPQYGRCSWCESALRPFLLRGQGFQPEGVLQCKGCMMVEMATPQQLSTFPKTCLPKERFMLGKVSREETGSV